MFGTSAASEPITARQNEQCTPLSGFAVTKLLEIIEECHPSPVPNDASSFNTSYTLGNFATGGVWEQDPDWCPSGGVGGYQYELTVESDVVGFSDTQSSCLGGPAMFPPSTETLAFNIPKRSGPVNPGDEQLLNITLELPASGTTDSFRTRVPLAPPPDVDPSLLDVGDCAITPQTITQNTDTFSYGATVSNDNPFAVWVDLEFFVGGQQIDSERLWIGGNSSTSFASNNRTTDVLWNTAGEGSWNVEVQISNYAAA